MATTEVFGFRAHAADASTSSVSVHATWEVPLEKARAAAAEHVAGGSAPRVTVRAGAGRAAGILARGEASGALSALEQASATVDLESWVVREMTRARALRLEGRSDAAVSALEEVLRSSHRDRPFPRDVLGYELARARVAWATDLEAPASVADPQLRRAAAELARLMKHEPLRNLAELRVLHARALAAVDGGSELGQRRAAQRAERALSQILTDYPRHPLVGELRLMRARALVRMKKPRVAFVTMRSIWIERAGEPEAEAARRAMIELARIHRALKVRAPTRSEKLQRSKYARGLRRFGVSRQILNDILTAPRLPRHQRDEALRERAYTAYRQRDYGRCVADLREIYRKAAGVPADLVRCLERAHQYDEAMDVYLAMAGKHSGGGKAAFIWEAIELGFRGGRYARVRDLLSRYENLSKRHEARRGYLRAWIAYRLGDDRAAIDGLSAYARQCRGTQRAMARYFRGKILFLRGANDSERAEGRAILTDIAQDHPLSYYGLAARQRLLDGGHPLPPPEVAVVPDEAEVLDWRETEILLRELAERFDGAFVGLPRAAQLFAAGYLEEARRELRFTSEAAINGLTRMRGRRIRVPRSEALYVGLGWRSDWDYPKPLPGKGGRAALRNPAERDALLRGLRRLALAMDEPYYFAKFTPAVDHDVQSRWHPRAYREAVEREAEARTLNPEHLWALMYTESRFRRHVVSHMGARGALQIMPATGRRLAARLEFIDSKDRFDADQLFDIDYNVHLSAYYVAELMQKFRGQATFAYAAYNGGPNSVARWLTAKHGTPEPLEVDTFIEEIAFRETRRYTKRVMAVRAAYHLLYHGKLPRWDNSVNSEILDNIDF